MITKTKLYNGEVELVFDDVKHTYEANGEIVFGVTSITGILDKPALLYWVNNVDCEYLTKSLKPGMVIDELTKTALISGMKGLFRKKSGEAADIGTMVHKYLEQYINAVISGNPTPELPINRDIRKAVEAFFSWCEKNQVKFLASERKVYSRKHKYAGTLDALGYVNGKLSIIDFKTSSGIYGFEMFPQVAAYCNCVEEEDGEKVETAYIVRVPKDGSEFEVQEIDDLDLHFKSFLGLHENYKRFRYMKQKDYESEKLKLKEVVKA